MRNARRSENRIENPLERHRRDEDIVDGARVPNCVDVRAFLDGKPDAETDETADAVVQHIETCTRCRGRLDELSPAHAGEASAGDPLMDMAREIVDAIESGRVRPSIGERSELANEQRLSEFSGQFFRGMVLRTARSAFKIVALIRKHKCTESYRAVQIDERGATVRDAVVAIPCVEDFVGQEAEDRLAQMQQMTAAQAQLLHRLAGLRHVAQLIDSGEYVHYLGETMRHATFLAYERVDGVELDTHLRATHAIDEEFRGVQTAVEFFRWARSLTTAILGIHQRLVIHGDLCPQNVLVTRQEEPVLVSVGKSVFFEGMRDAHSFRGWAYRAPEGSRSPGSDLYSLGALFLYIATGEEPKPTDIERCPTRDDLKKYITARIKEVNPRLYKDDRSVVDVIVACLRQDGRRVQHAGELLQDIETFEPLEAPQSILEGLLRLTDVGATLEKTGNALFRAIAGREIAMLQRVMADMTKGVFDIRGTSHDIRSAAHALISKLGRGDALIAVSIPRFWSAENILMDGKYLTMNLNAAARGARIRRLFLLDSKLTDANLDQMVAAQLNGVADLDEAARENYQVRYVQMSPSRRNKFIATGKHFAMLIKDGDRISMFPVYDGERLVMLRFRSDPAYAEGLVEVFEELWEEAPSLSELAESIVMNRKAG
jgi:serine/threonine protein kinase